VKTEAFEAVYEHGGFRLIPPADIKLSEGQKVRLVVEPVETPEEILLLAGRAYEGLSNDQIDAVGQYSRRRTDFFGERTPAR
jgi:predicted DNA-binding antitoxin AbrB/MazE fold protein